MIPKKIIKLLEQGYCFEQAFKIVDKFFMILLYNHGRKCRKLFCFIGKICNEIHHIVTGGRSTDHRCAIYGGDVIDQSISQQIIEFCIDHSENIVRVTNYIGWCFIGHISIKIDERPPLRLYHRDYKFHPAEIRKIDLPDAIAPLSSIICDYAGYSFYDFLVDEFESL